MDETANHRLYFEADYQGDANAPSFSGAVNTGVEDLYSAEIHLIPSRRPRYPHNPVLARVRGLYITTEEPNGYVPSWRLRVAHISARDNEHSPVYLFYMNTESPVIEEIRPNYISFLATIADITAYPLGANPLEGTQPELCNYCKEIHATGLFIPPERPELKALAGSLIRVVLSPLKDLSVETPQLIKGPR
jgi:hypothetical protein